MALTREELAEKWATGGITKSYRTHLKRCFLADLAEHDRDLLMKFQDEYIVLGENMTKEEFEIIVDEFLTPQNKER